MLALSPICQIPTLKDFNEVLVQQIGHQQGNQGATPWNFTVCFWLLWYTSYKLPGWVRVLALD